MKRRSGFRQKEAGAAQAVPALRTAVPADQAVASQAFQLSMLEYELSQARAEITRLTQLAYVAGAEADPASLTWLERSRQLETQLAQAAPEAAKGLAIEWLTDDHDCETCGSSWAEGAIVRLNGEVILNMSPCAYCYDSTSYSSDQVYRAILEHLGYAIAEQCVEADTAEDASSC